MQTLDVVGWNEGARSVSHFLAFFPFSKDNNGHLKKHQSSLSMTHATQTQHDDNSKKTIRSHHRDTEEQ